MTKSEQLAASVRQRLKNLTGKSDFQTTLVLYALERESFFTQASISNN
jgi:hypothetical protein